MRVLISGGKKTINIIKAVQPRFSYGNVEFIMEENISNIESLLSRGEHFDRAIIIEQSWNNDNEETDLLKMGIEVSNFVSIFKQRCSKDTTCIFLTSNETMARVAAGEILEVSDRCKVVLKELPYVVSFFIMLITEDINLIPENLIFKLMSDNNNNQEIEEGNVDDEVDTWDDYSRDGMDSCDDLEIDVDKMCSIDNKAYEWDNTTESSLDEGFNNEESNENYDDTGCNEDNIHDEEEIEFNSDCGWDTIEDDTNGESNILLEDNIIPDEEGYILSDDKISVKDVDDIYLDIVEGENKNYNIIDDYSSASDINKMSNESKLNRVDVGKGSWNSVNNRGYEMDVDKHKNNINTLDVMEVRSGCGIPKEYSEEIYSKEDDYVDNTSNDKNLGERKNVVDIGKLKSILYTLSNRGTSFVVTGTGCTGASTIALNISNLLVKMGYTVLLVDMDVDGRTQSYLSKEAYEAVHSQEPCNISLKLAINNSSLGVTRYANIIYPGFHVLTIGLAADIIKACDIADKQKIIKFANNVRGRYNFIVYDIPFRYAINEYSDIIHMADNILLTVDSTSWGVMKFMLAMANIESNETSDLLFSRAKICFNKHRKIDTIFGERFKGFRDILNKMDKKVKELTGVSPDNKFSNIQICGIIDYIENMEKHWFSKKQFSDTANGYDIIIGLLYNILNN